MLIDGEKWACDACVRGHRVSNCQHSDRPLQHINKKGRPVSQCHHCRGLRKSRSAHVKCDCGESAHSLAHCTHPDKGVAIKSEQPTVLDLILGAPKSDSTSVASDGSMCCCSHGGKCSCSLKKEQHLDPITELGSTGDSDGQEMPIFVKPRLMTTHSESALTVFANGHHKPVHKHNHMSQKCGVPYTIPRPHTVHGNHELARRSVDSLPATSTVEAGHTPAMIKESIVSAQQEQRMVRSEHGSPHPTAVVNFDDISGPLPPLDLNLSDYGLSSRSQLDLHSVTSAPYDTYYCATPDTDQPIMSAGLDAPSVDWSHFDLGNNNNNNNSSSSNNNNNAFSSYNQPPSYASFEYRNFAHPEMSNASSGEPSEHGDFIPFSNPSPVQPPSLVHNRFPSDSSELCETDSYRISSTSSFQGLPQMAMLASNNIENLDIDDYINATASSASPFLSAAAITATTPTTADDSPKMESTVRPSFSGSIDRFTSSDGSPPHHKLGPTSAPATTAADDGFANVTLSTYPFEKATPTATMPASVKAVSSAPTTIPEDDVTYASVPEEPSPEAFWMPSSFDLASLDQLNDVAAGQDVWSS